MLKNLAVGVSTLVLAGGGFMTAQALSAHGHQLPRINAPLTVQPAGSQTTGPTTTATAPTATGGVPCRDAGYPTMDSHGHGSDDSSDHVCDDLQTVGSRPRVLTDDHGRHGEMEPGDDRGGQGETEPGDDHGGPGETEPGDDHGGRNGSDDISGSGSGGSGRDDRGGDDNGGRG
jgi:hypothetical protein